MKKALLGLLLAVIALSVYGQYEEQEVDKSDPYYLMSSYYETDFHPFKKGNFYTGFAFSLTTGELENTNRLLYEVSEGEENQYNLIFKGGYFIGDYNMIGVDVVYGRSRFEGDILQNSESLLRQRISSSGTFRPVLVTYFPLTKNKRLSFYNKIGVGLSWGNTLERNTGSQGDITKKYDDNFGLSVGISPGITFFVIQNFAFEVELQNMLGYQHESVKSTSNDDVVSRRSTNQVSFDIDLLSLKLGLAYYFNRPKKH
ncbi:MAG: hypothetical protein ACK5MG_09460 [Bacteroidales bacterium]